MPIKFSVRQKKLQTILYMLDGAMVTTKWLVAGYAENRKT